ncbi:CRISPR type III-A/MTUBE-associated RAMP protein Csm4 [Cyclonatronum proteinivorum]|uniref:CRISPR system Cms protein Csm4 n=1 Tax=Cyclonatronum proteinivorum TaxID=1457365 RepID=A0A345UPN8_9BACT|nr:hypothetical protein [Cyclonatronum proteinivorum]AXJ02440.1 CRISPR type III-A/MTUBE-associated RAMP protein Csm4 [Cyclonatronum proteinivorum]
MKTEVVFLKPLAPFHLQTGGLSHESTDVFPRADTLSAALTYLWFRQYGEVPGFPHELPFRISSCFPVVVDEQGNQIQLYPKPLGVSIDPSSTDHKMFKSIDWIDEVLFEKWRIAGKDFMDIPSDANDKRLAFGGKVLLAEPRSFAADKLYDQLARTRVVLDRVTQASVPFHYVQTHFSASTLFSIHIQVDAAHKDTFMALLRLLGDEGIGADRTVGMGQFEVLPEVIEREYTEKEPVSKWFNLGIFNPGGQVGAIQWEDSVYSIVNRSGWVSGTSLRRSPVIAVGESALLKTAGASAPEGTIPLVLDKDSELIPEAVRIDHHVYRDCRGFFIPTMH